MTIVVAAICFLVVVVDDDDDAHYREQSQNRLSVTDAKQLIEAPVIFCAIRIISKIKGRQ